MVASTRRSWIFVSRGRPALASRLRGEVMTVADLTPSLFSSESIDSIVLLLLLLLLLLLIILVSLYGTVGAVATTSESNSSRNRSVKTSAWSNPKNPHRNPGPNAAETSGKTSTDASFSVNRDIDSRNFSKSSAEDGKMPWNTIGFAILNPTKGVTVSRFRSFRLNNVSPTLCALTSRSDVIT